MPVVAVLVAVEARFTERPRRGDGFLVRLMRFIIRRASRDQRDVIEDELRELRERDIHLVNAVDGSVYLYFWCRTREAVQCLMEWIDSGQLAAAIEKLINLATAGEENLSVSCMLVTNKIRPGKYSTVLCAICR